MHHDAIRPLPLHHRLGHAQFVYPVIQRGTVLIHRVILHFLEGGRVQVEHQHPLLGIGIQREFRQRVTQQGAGGIGVCGVGELHAQLLAILLHVAVTNAFVFQRQFDLAGPGFHALVHHRFHIHLQQEMHTTAQIQAQIHRRSTNGTQPSWSSGRQIQGHHIVIAEGTGQKLAGTKLAVIVSEAHQPGAAINLFTGPMFQTRLIQLP